jgi:hypothetical protein
MAKARKESKGSRNKKNLKKRMDLIKKNIEILERFSEEKK